MLQNVIYNSILLKIIKLNDCALAQKLQDMIVKGIKNVSYKTLKRE